MRARFEWHMAVVTFRCPTSGFHVHAWLEADDSQSCPVYETVNCIACQGTHLVDAKSGHVIGDAKDE